MTRRALIYCRISQDRAGAGLNVESQREDCQKLASSLGWTVVGVYTDNDISAYSGKPRPGYRALLADLTEGRADAVVAWHVDRLHRSPMELEEYVNVCESHGVVTQSVKVGELDLATASGRAVARTLGAWARFESEHKSDRIRRKHEQSAIAGRWRGGGRPFGWKVLDDGTAVLNEPEAAVVRDAATVILAGGSIGSVVSDLNARGITTSTGRPWNYTSLRQVVTRPRNAGLSELRGEVVGRMEKWPAILSEDTWAAVCAVLRDPGRRKSQSNRVRWMLAGLAVCGAGDCGHPLRSAPVGTDRHGGATHRTVYRCPVPGRGHVARDAVMLDDYVARSIVGRLSQPDARALLTITASTAGPAAESEAATLRARIAEADTLFADGEISGAQLARINARLRGRLEAIDQALAARARDVSLAAFSGHGRDAASVWASRTVEERRGVIRALMTVVVLPIGRGSGRDIADGVRLDWRTDDDA